MAAGLRTLSFSFSVSFIAGFALLCCFDSCSYACRDGQRRACKSLECQSVPSSAAGLKGAGDSCTKAHARSQHGHCALSSLRESSSGRPSAVLGPLGSQLCPRGWLMAGPFHVQAVWLSTTHLPRLNDAYYCARARVQRVKGYHIPRFDLWRPPRSIDFFSTTAATMARSLFQICVSS